MAYKVEETLGCCDLLGLVIIEEVIEGRTMTIPTHLAPQLYSPKENPPCV